MSLNRQYIVPTYTDLLLQLINKNNEDFIKMLKTYLHDKLGIDVINVEQVILDDSFQDIKGLKITFSDGRVFTPKFIGSSIKDDNLELNTYEWYLEDETGIKRDSKNKTVVEELVDESDNLWENDFYGGYAEDFFQDM